MSSATKSMIHSIPVIFIFALEAFAKHAHHHHVRQVAVAVPIISANDAPTTTISATRVSSQASSEVISDIKDIQEGLDDLPGNLLSYIQSVDQRLATVEALLQSLLANATPTTIAELPSAPVVETSSVGSSSSRRAPAPFPATAAAVPASSTAAPTGTAVLSSAYRTSRFTSTRTSVATVTRHMPIPVFSTGALPRPYSYAPIGNGTLANPTAGLSASGTGAKVVTLTVAVLPVPSTVTLPLSLAGSVPTTFATLVRTA